jgi:hypothetical protein
MSTEDKIAKTRQETRWRYLNDAEFHARACEIWAMLRDEAPLTLIEAVTLTLVLNDQRQGSSGGQQPQDGKQ